MSGQNRKTPEEIRRAGLEALCRELGPVGMVRFLEQFATGRGDYTAERHEWLGNPTVAELAAEIQDWRKQHGSVVAPPQPAEDIEDVEGRSVGAQEG